MSRMAQFLLWLAITIDPATRRALGAMARITLDQDADRKKQASLDRLRDAVKRARDAARAEALK